MLSTLRRWAELLAPAGCCSSACTRRAVRGPRSVRHARVRARSHRRAQGGAVKGCLTLAALPQPASSSARSDICLMSCASESD
eukprot:5495720-Prymnesium_polylepis.1